MVYPFLLNMWIMKRLDEQYLTVMVTLKKNYRRRKTNDFSYTTNGLVAHKVDYIELN